MLNRIKDRVTHAENTMQILKWASYMSDPYLFFQVVYYSTPKV